MTSTLENNISGSSSSSSPGSSSFNKDHSVDSVDVDVSSPSTVVPSLRILLLTNAYNSMCQSIHLSLLRFNHTVMIELAITPEQMLSTVTTVNPDVIICPFLTKRVLPEIYNNYTTIVVHPGIKGDRGMSSLDWVLLKQTMNAGVTLLSAEEEMDAGPIWATKTFPLQRWNACGETKPAQITKSSLYKHEVIQAALSCLQVALQRVERSIPPIPLDYNDPTTLGTLLPTMKQSDHTIDWNTMTAIDIARIVRSRDTQPGVLVKQFAGQQDVWVYGAHVENAFDSTIACDIPYLQNDPIFHQIHEKLLSSPPQTILATRDDAVLISCAKNTALWITHMKRAKSNTDTLSCRLTNTSTNTSTSTTKNPLPIKLPSCMVLDSSLISNVLSWPLPLCLSPFHDTFREIWLEIDGRVGYLYFEFYNGAMSTKQCQRLRDALRTIKKGNQQSHTTTTKTTTSSNINNINTIVLMGGSNFFSNGINLNTIENAMNPTSESHNNINAMNEVCFEIMDTPSHATVSVFRGNAGAGGVMMAIAADHVVAHSHVILNPHYKSMGLYGSEYWTFNLPKRVGYTKAQELTEAMLPIDSHQAKQCGLIDQIAGDDLFSLSRVLPGLCRDISNNVAGVWTRYIDRKYSPAAAVMTQDAAVHPAAVSSIPHQRSTWLHLVDRHRQQEMLRMGENFLDAGYIEARTRFVNKACKYVTPMHLAVLGGRQVIVDGAALAAPILKHITDTIQEFKNKNPWPTLSTHARAPGLCIIRVGDDIRSLTYVRMKEKRAKAMGYSVKHIHFQDSGTGASDISHLLSNIITSIRLHNNDATIDGVMVQLPLPNSIHHETNNILKEIQRDKDVDGLHPDNVIIDNNTNCNINQTNDHDKKIIENINISQFQPPPPQFVPATVRAIMHILSSYDVPLSGKNVLIVGSGPLVGSPCADICMKRHATVTVANIHTKQLETYVKQADVIISAAGVPCLIRSSWLKRGAAVIDVGGAVGDVEPLPPSHYHHGLITPVPNGVGPITIAMLLQQTMESYQYHMAKQQHQHQLHQQQQQQQEAENEFELEAAAASVTNLPLDNSVIMMKAKVHKRKTRSPPSQPILPSISPPTLFPTSYRPQLYSNSASC